MSAAAAVVLTVLESYLLGSICFGIIFTRLYIHKDIRDFGSGNAGMTNVLRSVGASAGALTGIGDFAKGAAAIVIGRALFSAAALEPMLGGYLAAAGALAGHLFPLYFNFRGGKGVMITAGMLLVLDPWLLLAGGLAFGITFAISRIVSLSSLVAALVLPIANFVITTLSGTERLYSTIFCALISAFIIFMHRANIKRILAGEEKKLVIKKPE